MLGRVRKLERSRDVGGLVELVRHGGVVTRVAAVNALGSLGDKSAEPVLLEALGDPSSVVRMSAASALARVSPAITAAEISRAIHDDDPARNLSAEEVVYHGLWLIPGLDLADTVAEALASARDVDRANYIHTLGEMGDSKVAPAIAHYLEDSHSGVRLSAVEALGRLRYAEAVDALAARTADDDRDVARAAVAALEEIGVHARGALREIAQTAPSRDIRRRARRASAALAQ